MSRPRLLDLYCGAGGCSVGYYRAGFDVVGVDNRPMPRYPFEFHQGDALEFVEEHGKEFDAIHASPPCQMHSVMRRGRWQDRNHPELVEPTRALLLQARRPYVIENVPGAPLIDPVTLCGTMFGLGVQGAQLRRHRLFECPWSFFLLPTCAHNAAIYAIGEYGGGQNPGRRYHKPRTVGVYGHSGGRSDRDMLMQYGVRERRQAMGIDWMTQAELSQAIPPAYTEFIGRQLLAHVNNSK